MWLHPQPLLRTLTRGIAGLKNFAQRHIIVKHEDGGYVHYENGIKFHTQNIENFWSQLKRGYIGIYHYMSPKHLHRYCEEFATRYNQRKDGNIARFLHVIKNSDVPKVTYAVLTGE